MRDLKGWGLLEDQDIDGRIVVKYMLHNHCLVISSKYKWLVTGFSDELSEIIQAENFLTSWASDSSGKTLYPVFSQSVSQVEATAVWRSSSAQQLWWWWWWWWRRWWWRRRRRRWWCCGTGLQYFSLLLRCFVKIFKKNTFKFTTPRHSSLEREAGFHFMKRTRVWCCRAHPLNPIVVRYRP